jgi:hypothetical protein
VPMHSDTRGDFQFFTINSGEDSDIVVGSTGGGDKSMVLVNHFNKMADYKRHSLDPLQLLF